MYKKIMLSAAAAMTLTTAGMAFDVMINKNADGSFTNERNNTIVTHSTILENGFITANYNPNYPEATDGTLIRSGYKNGFEANETLRLSDNQFGDALIYPAFKTGNGWNSDIVVTNKSNTEAMVAKVVLYAADDSRELIDFNIYLSAKDVFKFNISDEGVTTVDDSIEVNATRAQDITANSDADKVTMNKYGDKRTIAGKLPVEAGYAVIYGMAQASGKNGTNSAYHTEHDQLFLDYRELLDLKRDGDVWRQALVSSTHMKNGMIIDDIQAPDVENNLNKSSKGSNAYFSNKSFKDPEANLFGTVTISNDASGDELSSRDLEIPATALENFTSNNMMLWTAGEMATISDRRIISDDNTSGTASDYNTSGVVADAKTFEISKAYFTYNDKEVANKLHVTSPVKRPLVQLQDNEVIYWKNFTVTAPYGGYNFKREIYNEREDNYTVSNVDSDIIVSPYNPDEALPDVLIMVESGAISNFLPDTIDKAKYNKGYVEVTYPGIPGKKYPAIVTQMSAKTVNSRPHTNWISAPVEK